MSCSATIVVPSRGGRQRLPILLDSAARQTTDDFEVIVVVDGDVDDTASLLADYPHLPVRSIVFPENRGRPSALNAGFTSARGEVLIRADDDLELEPDFVEHHCRLHAEAPRGVIAMCRDVFPDTPYARVYGAPADRAIRTAAAGTAADRTWLWWSGNVSTTAADFRAVGPYDESFRSYGWEDIEWGYRLHRLGRDIHIAPGFDTLHHGPVTTAAERLVRAFHSGEAYRRFIAKHGAEAMPFTPPTRSAWNTAVRTASFAATEGTVRGAGRALDASIARLPRWLAEKLVALAVQASSDAGRRYPDRVRSHV